MITLDYEMRLLGVGYDNRLYRKVKNSKDLNVEKDGNRFHLLII